MVTSLQRWFVMSCLVCVFASLIFQKSSSFASGKTAHPYFVSVTEIQHNAKMKTLEISCKIFTDDFEKTLRQNYRTYVDLLNPKNRAAMDSLISNYIKQHLKIVSNGKPLYFKYVGYENDNEAVWSYFEADDVVNIKTIVISNSLLFEYKKQQTNLLHVTVNSIRKSTRLNNPESKVSFTF